MEMGKTRVEGREGPPNGTITQKRFHLSLSNKKLSKLLPMLPIEPGLVSSLDCSRNEFKHIDCLARLENCDEITASHNKLVNFSSFAPIHRSLKVLDVSHNEISDTTHLCALQHLTVLVASYNAINGLPVMSRMANLVHLNLASNRISSIVTLRGLCKLPKLECLILTENKIASLRNAEKHLPPRLKHFDLSGNAIADLTEAFHLSSLKELEHLIWRDNPCAPKDRKFDYRAFLLCCCSQALQIVDEKELTELEILKGELLLTKGKLRRCQNHESICNYLTEECPLNVPDAETCKTTDFEKRVKKVIAKRREYLNSNIQKTQSTSHSLPPSPFAQWTERDPNRTSVSEAAVVQKENRPPGTLSGASSEDSILSSTTVILSTSHDASSSLIPEIRSDDVSVRRSSSTPIIDRTPKTGKDNTGGRALGLAKKEDAKAAGGQGTAPLETLWGHTRKITSPLVLLLEERLQACEKRCGEIEAVVTELSKHNQQLSQTNEALTRIIEELSERMLKLDADAAQGWKKLIHFAVPVPVDLKYERRSPTEVLLKWRHCSVIQPTGHGFTVNNDFIGKSHASTDQTLISDLLPDKEATIKVHCYVEDVEGEQSLPLYIPPYAASGKQIEKKPEKS